MPSTHLSDSDSYERKKPSYDYEKTQRSVPTKKRSALEKYPAFFLLAACAISFTAPLAFFKVKAELDKDYTSASKSVVADIASIVANSTNAGYFTKNIALEVRKAKSDNYDKTSYAHSTMVKNCDLVIALNKDAEFDWGEKAFYEQLKILPSEKQFNKEWVVLHESSHCEFDNIKEPLLVKNNPELQKDINFYYKYTSKIEEAGKPTKHAGVYALLNENFADSYAFTQLLKKNEASPEVLNFLYKHQALRFQAATYFWQQNQMVENHNSAYTIDYLTQLDTLKAIKETNDPLKLKEIALEAANYGVGKILTANYEKIMGPQSLLESVSDNIYVAANNSDRYEVLAKNTGRTMLEDISVNVAYEVSVGKINGKDSYAWGTQKLNTYLRAPEFTQAYQGYYAYIQKEYAHPTLPQAADKLVPPDLSVNPVSLLGTNYILSWEQKMKTLPTLQAALSGNEGAHILLTGKSALSPAVQASADLYTPKLPGALTDKIKKSRENRIIETLPETRVALKQ